MNDNEGTRNFEPVQPEEKQSPKKVKSDPKKKISIAIFTVVIAIVLLFCAIIVTKIVYEINGPSDEEGKETPDSIEFLTIQKSTADINKGLLLSIVSSDGVISTPSLHSIIPSVAGDPYYMGTSGLPKDKLTPEAGAALAEMAKALYEAKSVRFIVAYAYHNNPADDYDAEHVLGTVVDLKQMTNESEMEYGPFTSSILKWLNEHCAEYGFINSFPNDTDSSFEHDKGASARSIQFRYVGVAHATYIMKNGLTFSEYLTKIKDYTPEKPLSVTANGDSYAIYYVKSTGDTTEVKVPDNYAYEISGNNKDGFIITVKLSEKE